MTKRPCPARHIGRGGERQRADGGYASQANLGSLVLAAT